VTARFPAGAPPDRLDIPIWGMTATLTVTDPSRLTAAAAVLTEELAAVDEACSRFRPDSEISRALRRPGREQRVSPLLNEAIGAALRVAAATDFLVDPTVGGAVIALGYDRDFADLTRPGDGAPGRAIAGPFGVGPAPGAWRIQHDAARHTLLIPAGVGLDLGATAKALAADRAARRIAHREQVGVLVSIGGDVAVAGQAPAGGWRIAIGEHHRTAEAERNELVAITAGGLATSSTTVRAWATPQGPAHHIIDPRTGWNPETCWRTVSAAAASCLDANAATTAAIVLGARAPAWLRRHQIPARLVFLDFSVVTAAGWPADRGRVA